MASKYDAFLDASASEEFEDDQGYDSEAAEQSKGRRSTHNSGRERKRRRLSDRESESDADNDVPAINDIPLISTIQNSSPSTALEDGTRPVNKTYRRTTS